MQKLINVLAVLSFGVSSAVVAGGAYLYLNQEEIKESIKQEAMEQISGMVQGQLGQVLFGAGDDAPSLGSGDSSVPSVPFGF